MIEQGPVVPSALPAPPPADSHPRRPWAAVIFSIVPGMGHLYAGRWKRGVAVWLLRLSCDLSIIALLTWHLTPATFAGSLGAGLGVVLFVYIDAYRCARRADSPYVLRPYNRWYAYVGIIVVAISLSLLMPGPSVVGLKSYRTPSSAMVPTLALGDYFVAQRLPAETVARGTIVTFVGSMDTYVHVKRVIGLPGDTLSMRNGVLTENGRVPVEPYLDIGADCPTQLDTALRNWGPAVVPSGSYFMLGDNRDCSTDSRSYGAIPRDDIRERALFVYFSRVGPDIWWSRIGTVLK